MKTVSHIHHTTVSDKILINTRAGRKGHADLLTFRPEVRVEVFQLGTSPSFSFFWRAKIDNLTFVRSGLSFRLSGILCQFLPCSSVSMILLNFWAESTAPKMCHPIRDFHRRRHLQLIQLPFVSNTHFAT